MNKLTGIGIALAGLAALAGCGTAAAAPHATTAPVVHVTHTVTAAPRPAKTVIVTHTAAPAPAAPAPVPRWQQPSQDGNPAGPDYSNSASVVTQFYQDITDQDYPAAWSLGGDNIGGTDYTAWVDGYDTTASIALGTISSFGSDQVTAELIATQDDGSVKTYNGTYTVTNGVITGADIVQTG